MSDIIKINEVAVMCNVSDTTVRTWVRDRGFPASIGARWNRSEVIRWCKSNRVPVRTIEPVK